MQLLVKFQLHILKAFGVIVLQSSSNMKIDLYSKCRENKLQALTKTYVTCQWSNAQTRNSHHRVCHKLKNRLHGTLYPILLCITQTN